jgi:hypothetical protein
MNVKKVKAEGKLARFCSKKEKPKEDKKVEELPAREKLKMMVTNH